MKSLKVQPVTEEEEEQGVRNVLSIQSAPPSEPVQLPPLQNSPAAAQEEGAGEEKVPEGESTSHLTSALLAPSSAAAATLREDADDAAPATGASAATTDAANANADETTTSGGGDTEEEIGGDTHVVAFEGARGRIIVVAKKMTMTRWFIGSDEGKAVYEIRSRV